jgi:hypothetical protein
MGSDWLRTDQWELRYPILGQWEGGSSIWVLPPMECFTVSSLFGQKLVDRSFKMSLDWSNLSQSGLIVKLLKSTFYPNRPGTVKQYIKPIRVQSRVTKVAIRKWDIWAPIGRI